MVEGKLQVSRSVVEDKLQVSRSVVEGKLQLSRSVVEGFHSCKCPLPVRTDV